MSRCYPFPPPGYVRNRSRDEPRDEPLIESIKKIQGAEEKAKKEHKRKERKREKKEKKRKNRDRGEGESKKDSHKKRRKDKDVKDSKDDQKLDLLHKLKQNETECLEKSSLTTEPELQTTSQNSCDSTVNSNGIPEQHQKQPQQQQPQPQQPQQQQPQQQQQLLDGRHNDSESSLRIRLAVRRQQKDPQVMLTDQDQQQCPSPSRGTTTIQQPSPHTKTPRHQPPVHGPCSTSATIPPPEHTLKPCEEKRKEPISQSSKQQSKKHSKEKKTQEAFQPSSLCRKCPPSIAQQFLNVVENWVPKTLNNLEDEECWYVKTSNQKFDNERCKQLNSKQVVVSSSMVWPCALLLPEVDVYALPFTVPF